LCDFFKLLLITITPYVCLVNVQKFDEKKEIILLLKRCGVMIFYSSQDVECF